MRTFEGLLVIEWYSGNAGHQCNYPLKPKHDNKIDSIFWRRHEKYVEVVELYIDGKIK